MSNGWYAVDFDETLARHDPDLFPEPGEPIAHTIDFVRHLLKRGNEVRIFTARASLLDYTLEQRAAALDPVRRFCVEHFGRELEITCSKDYRTIAIIDDRAAHPDALRAFRPPTE